MRRIAILAFAAAVAVVATTPAAFANGNRGGHPGNGHIGNGHVGNGHVGGGRVFNAPVHNAPAYRVAPGYRYVHPHGHIGAGRWIAPAIGLGLGYELYRNRNCCWGPGYRDGYYYDREPLFVPGPVIIEEPPIVIERPAPPRYDNHPDFTTTIPVEHWNGREWVPASREVLVQWDRNSQRYYYVLDGTSYWL